MNATILRELAEARRHLESGEFERAERLYAQILRADRCNKEALQGLGVLSIQTGKPQAAVDFIEQAIALDGSDANSHNQLGVAYAGLQQLERAAECFRRAIQLDARSVDAHYNLGNALRSLHRLPEAVEQYRLALEIHPDSAETHYNLANALRDLRRLDEAIASYQEALRIKPDYLKAYTNLGNAFRDQRKFDQAQQCYRKALQIQPDYARPHYNLGSLAGARGRFEEAETHYREALRIDPSFLPARNGLGRALAELGRLDEAIATLAPTPEADDDLIEAQVKLGEKLRLDGRLDDAVACARRVVQARPDAPMAHNNLGLALAAGGKLAEAVASYQEALRIRPDFAEVHVNLAVALEYLERSSEALEHLETALRIKPTLAVAHLNRAVTWLRRGDFQRGWLEFEWRRHCREHRLRKFRRPLWTGAPMPHGTILLHAEQGLGDTMQMVRYVPLVKQRFRSVVVECQKPLRKLLSCCAYIDRLVARGQELPDHDVQAPLMSLPVIFGTTLETIPADVPYLFAEKKLVESWRERLGGYRGFKVGIAWQGSRKYPGDAHRSIPLRHFAPLAKVRRVELFSLQKGPGSEQLAELPDDFPVIDFGSGLDGDAGPFMDTAAIMQNLDLLITSDTSVVHLAGAMGLPIWVALSRAADWRWLEDRDDSPWYPTMRLFRQSRLGDWDQLFRRIADELRKLVDGDTSRLAPSPRCLPAALEIPIAPGELLDKITILQIKCERMSEERPLRNVRHELDRLSAARRRCITPSAELTALCDELKSINAKLWDIENEIRACEARKDFGDRFVELARAVYITNDRRAAVKRKINMLLGSTLIEEKDYAPYR